MKRDSGLFHKIRLYIRGSTLKAELARRSLQEFCEAHLAGRHALEIIDIEECPERAQQDDVIAVPMLVRVEPGPKRRIVGDLMDEDRLLLALDLWEEREIPPAPIHRGA